MNKCQCAEHRPLPLLSLHSAELTPLFCILKNSSYLLPTSQAPRSQLFSFSPLLSLMPPLPLVQPGLGAVVRMACGLLGDQLSWPPLPGQFRAQGRVSMSWHSWDPPHTAWCLSPLHPLTLSWLKALVALLKDLQYLNTLLQPQQSCLSTQVAQGRFLPEDPALRLPPPSMLAPLSSEDKGRASKGLTPQLSTRAWRSLLIDLRQTARASRHT